MIELLKPYGYHPGPSEFTLGNLGTWRGQAWRYTHPVAFVTLDRVEGNNTQNEKLPMGTLALVMPPIPEIGRGIRVVHLHADNDVERIGGQVTAWLREPYEATV
jgi:hypothetical protein